MSTVKANDLMKVDGGIPTVKGQRLIPTAWVNFNGTGTVAIRDSENVSSVTDNGTGYFTINFTTVMDNANYCPTGLSRWNSFDNWVQSEGDPLTTSYKIGITKGGSVIDSSLVTIAILGGQA